MTEEPTKHEISADDDQPATKGDVRRSQEEMATMMAESFATVATKGQMTAVGSRLNAVDTRLDGVDSRLDGLDSRLDKVDSRLDSLESGQEAILGVVKSIDAQLKEWKDIPAKVERLHKRVFGGH